MDNRVKLIFGEREVADINNFIILIDRPVIQVFKDGDKPVLIVYGELFYGAPTQSVSIALDKRAEIFSGEAQIINYIKYGIIDERISEQYEFYNTVSVYERFGKKIKEKVNEIENEVRSGKKSINIQCDVSEIVPAIKNYIKRNYGPRRITQGIKSITVDI